MQQVRRRDRRILGVAMDIGEVEREGLIEPLVLPLDVPDWTGDPTEAQPVSVPA